MSPQKRSPLAEDVVHERNEEDPPPEAKRSRTNRDHVITPPSSPPQAAMSPLAERHLNPVGKPAEAGVIQRIYVENFMCHRKLTVDLCRNVNFIHGQNGSGKSAILAAIQICLGAAARRTNRARNLKELVRKDATCSQAKVRVTLLNRGDDGYEHDIYGDSITVERTIHLRGGFNGYKLLDSNMKEQSKSKKDLDEMLDRLNIQVENPVAILDQEDSKKFLTGKGSDKYAFFLKATELERMDRSYAATMDTMDDIQHQTERMRRGIDSDLLMVQQLKKEWEKHKDIEKLNEKLQVLIERYAWARYKVEQQQVDSELEHVKKFREKAEKKQVELSQAEEALDTPDDEHETKKARIGELIDEARTQASLKKDLEKRLKQANEPQKQRSKQLKACEKEKQRAAKSLQQAKVRLEERRQQILEKAGSAESEAARRTERLREAEEELTSVRQKDDEIKQAMTDSRRAYEELEPHVVQAKQNRDDSERKMKAVEGKIRGLESSTGGNLAIFGERCNRVKQLVDKHKRRFKGPVVGPIGAYVKVVAGKEIFASIAELALGPGTLDRFIVTCDHDRRLFQQIRQEAGCRQDCGIFQSHPTGRYNVPGPPVDGIETVTSALQITDDLVFNCLVDNVKIESMALSKSKGESENLLLTEDSNGKFTIRGKVNRVFCLPNGDHWSVRGGSLAMVANDKQLKKSIGVDKTRALAEAKNDLEEMKKDHGELERELTRVDHQHTQHQKEWNYAKRDGRKIKDKINALIQKIDEIKAEEDSAATFDTDTSEHEQDVVEAEQNLELAKEKETALQEDIERHNPEIASIRDELEEVQVRNEKVLADMKTADEELREYAQDQSQREDKVKKRREKVQQLETILAQQEEKVEEVQKNRNKALTTARKLRYKREQREKIKEQGGGEGGDTQVSLLTMDSNDEPTQEPTQEELESIEVHDEEQDPDYFESRIQRAKDKIEREKQRREMSREDPAEAYEKYVRAKTAYSGKLEQIEESENTLEELQEDLRKRKRRWRQFQKHICNTTDRKFDEILNLRGSSGELDFDHKTQSLDLVVQKDAADENSQQKDVKALSGGERSFTTIALLLALGENLETPFRILDEFDVFLDPVSRKLAMESLIDMAKQMGHRQFIFITPQDVSSVKTDPMLKVLKLNPPSRRELAGSPEQQTLDFSQSQS